MARKIAEPMEQASFWAVNAAGAPEKTVLADHAFPATRQNDRFCAVPQVHPGNVGCNAKLT
jgi:hypothetical protein